MTASGGTKQCLGCRGGNPYQCSYQKRPQICATDFNSLGTTHCGSAIIKYREQRGGRISQSVLRGCINCAGWWNFVLKKPENTSLLISAKIEKTSILV